MDTSDAHATQLTLIHRLQAEPDDADWARFQAFYWDVITGWARQAGCPADMAEDIYQETMISLLRYLPQYDRAKARFRAFLKTIASRRINDAWRRHYRGPRDAAARDAESHRPLVADLSLLPAPESQEVHEDESVWLAGVVGEALRRTYARIDDTTYKSFCLNLLDGQSVAQIAASLNVDRNVIYNHKNRSMNILSQEFVAVIHELGERQAELGSVDSASFGNAMRGALDAYLKNRSDLRLTSEHLSVPGNLRRQVADFAALLQTDPPPDTDSAWLRVVEPDAHRWVAARDGMTIGRRDTCDLVLNDGGVSSLHARLEESPAGWQITDCQSRHGLWLAGQRIETAILRCGDQLQLGTTFLIFLPD